MPALDARRCGRGPRRRRRRRARRTSRRTCSLVTIAWIVEPSTRSAWRWSAAGPIRFVARPGAVGERAGPDVDADVGEAVGAAALLARRDAREGEGQGRAGERELGALVEAAGRGLERRDGPADAVLRRRVADLLAAAAAAHREVGRAAVVDRPDEVVAAGQALDRARLRPDGRGGGRGRVGARGRRGRRIDGGRGIRGGIGRRRGRRRGRRGDGDGRGDGAGEGLDEAAHAAARIATMAMARRGRDRSVMSCPCMGVGAAMLRAGLCARHSVERRLADSSFVAIGSPARVGRSSADGDRSKP